jgi:hypothetical protein
VQNWWFLTDLPLLPVAIVGLVVSLVRSRRMGAGATALAATGSAVLLIESIAAAVWDQWQIGHVDSETVRLFVWGGINVVIALGVALLVIALLVRRSDPGPAPWAPAPYGGYQVAPQAGPQPWQSGGSEQYAPPPY